MPAHSDAAPPSIISRPRSDFYGFIILLALAGVGMTAIAFFSWRDGTQWQPQNIWVGLAAIFALFFLPCLYMLWLMRHLRLLADARGLQIRGAFQTRFIAWRAIEDYELRPNANAATARLTWICANGKWRRLPQFYTNMEALRARIQTEAVESRARTWQLSVERDDAPDWPKTYAYRDPNGAKMFGVVAVGLLGCVLLISGSFGISANAKPSVDALDKWLPIAAIFLPLLLAHYAIMRARKRQNSRTIRADQNGLTLVGGPNPTRIAWNEIGDYSIADAKKGVALAQYIVESAGARIVFRQDITNFGELQALISARAIHAKSREWRHSESADTDTIGGAQSLWSGGVAGVGRKIYHYRTRTLRAVLVLGSALSLSLSAGFISALLWKKPPLVELLTIGFMCGIFLFFTISGALAFWRGSIQTDETGVYQCGIRGERFLRWSKIESFVYNGHFYALTGQNATIRYWLVAADGSLQAEIEAQTGLKLRRPGQSDDDE